MGEHHPKGRVIQTPGASGKTETAGGFMSGLPLDQSDIAGITFLLYDTGGLKAQSIDSAGGGVQRACSCPTLKCKCDVPLVGSERMWNARKEVHESLFLDVRQRMAKDHPDAWGTLAVYFGPPNMAGRGLVGWEEDETILFREFRDLLPIAVYATKARERAVEVLSRRPSPGADIYALAREVLVRATGRGPRKAKGERATAPREAEWIQSLKAELRADLRVAAGIFRKLREQVATERRSRRDQRRTKASEDNEKFFDSLRRLDTTKREGKASVNLRAIADAIRDVVESSPECAEMVRKVTG